ncbi:hypothetical protein BDV12DRAFT_171560 [Aspergillus spectabilis]
MFILSCYLLYVFSSIVLALSVERGFLPFLNFQKGQARQGQLKHSPSHLPSEYYCQVFPSRKVRSPSRHYWQERWGCSPSHLSNKKPCYSELGSNEP